MRAVATRRAYRVSAKSIVMGFAVLLSWSCTANATAGDLVLAAEGRSEYQVVLPDQYPSPAIGECLGQTARLLQTAFKANGVEVAVVPEGQRDPAKPAIYLGDTATARAAGEEVAA